MPWKETCAMNERTKLIKDWLKHEYTVRELGEGYGVSPKTVHKWLKRYKEGGEAALLDLTRAPYSHPNATPPEIVSSLLGVKLRHLTWGPKKVVDYLKKHYPDTPWPALSTTGSLFGKEGLVKERRLRRRTPPYTEPFSQCLGPNDSWSMDYKGQFRLGNGRLCYPFTVSDNFSRYLLACRGLYHPSLDDTLPLLKRAFEEYGLPLSIRSDNGAPFASVGLGGLSRLSAWLIRLHIRPERIEPGHPEQNGRHERMHRTLKEDACHPPGSCLRGQQRAFDRFRPDYNEERPNEAIGMATPSSLYRPSQRAFPAKLPPVEYDSWLSVRQVRSNGCIKWKGEFVYVSQALAGEQIGLRQRDERMWEIWFSFYPLGMMDEEVGKVLPMSPV